MTSCLKIIFKKTSKKLFWGLFGLLILMPIFKVIAKDDYPKLANYYLSWDITDDQAKELAKWDLVILHTQAVDRNPDILEILKRNNPKIKILAYFVAQEIAKQSLAIDPKGAWGNVYRQVDDQNWWLKDLDGNQLSYWSESQLINVAKSDSDFNLSSWLPGYIKNNYLDQDNNWDGVFYDNCWETIDWLKFNLDLNNDGQADSPAIQNQFWQKGLRTLLKNTNELIGPNKIIVCNTGSTYHDFYQGRMFETFPLSNEGGWAKNLNDYLTTGPFSIINSNGQNLNNQDNYQLMRYGLTSALLGPGYFAYDLGDKNHGQLWWYDEYNTSLGKPLGPARENSTNASNNNFINGLYTREFENGLVAVNSTNNIQTLNLLSPYEKLKGLQDPKINDGTLVTNITLKPGDGLILLKPLSNLIGVPYKNGDFVTIVNEAGQTIRNGFLAYQKKIPGVDELLFKDVNGDGRPEIFKTNQNTVYYYSEINVLETKFYPYGENFKFGFNILVVDLDNDGTLEILTVPKKNASAHVKMFSLAGRLLNPGFFAYNKKYASGAVLATADLDHNGVLEIITGPGVGYNLPIKIFNSSGEEVMTSFYPFGNKYSGGLSLGAGQLGNDSEVKLVISRLKGNNNEINIFSTQGELLNKWQINPPLPGGLELRVADLAGRGQNEIIILTRLTP
ncbi:MAG: putative glycoside hydrolase [Candidatus Komeilibacteria bacterium]|nr:putative glycoside hydrolase [Candidatus Komeilibacteria bacterium]